MLKQRTLQIGALLLVSVLLLAYNDNPPDGRTGAPFDGHCNNCHASNNPNNYNGLAEIVGLPDTIMPNTTYSLQIKVTATAGNPIKAGFQLVVVDKNNNNAGNITPTNSESDTDILGGREYLEHRGAKYFGGAPITWSFNWTSPDSVACNTLKFYFIANLCNGGGDFGDFSIAFNTSRYFDDGQTLSTSVSTISNVSCSGDSNGVVAVIASGGTPQYQYLWSNGSTGQTVDSLPAGTYTVTVTDQKTCTSTGQTNVAAQDTIPPQVECPPSREVCAGDTIFYPLPTVLDNCELVLEQPELYSGLPSGSAFPEGSTTMVYEATDGMGNTATCSFVVLGLPTPTVSLDTVVHDMDNTGTGRIEVTPGVNGSPLQFFWKKDGLFFPNTSEDLNGLFSGQYTLEVVDSNGCFALLGPIVITNTTGVFDVYSAGSALQVFPNPVTDCFRVEFMGQHTVSLRLIQMDGKVLLSWDSLTSENTCCLDNVLPGHYLLLMENQFGMKAVARLVKAE